MIKTPQEIERMKLANELAAIGMEFARENIRPGMKESEVAAMIEGHIHAVGVGYKSKVEMARAFTFVWSGKGIATFTATSHRPIQENEPTLVEIWVCADGYWTDLTKNLCPGKFTPEYKKFLDQLLKIFNEAGRIVSDGASLAKLTGSSALESTPPATRASPRIPSLTASALARTSRLVRTRPRPAS